MVEENLFVTPGEKIATEEEFASGSNTYVEEGVIYSAVIGNVVKDGGEVGVATAGREIKIIGKDMLVIGVVTDDMKSVMFVKLDDINFEKKDYLALKDGKIVEPRPPRFGPRPGNFGRDGGGENRFSSRSEKSEKPCGIGDTILARVQYNDKDSYQLSLSGRETGVIYSKCELCGGQMDRKDVNVLSCRECGHNARKKISELYNKPEEIKKLFA
jgi:exosome complex RNA-binding protein Csl4